MIVVLLALALPSPLLRRRLAPVGRPAARPGLAREGHCQDAAPGQSAPARLVDAHRRRVFGTGRRRRQGLYHRPCRPEDQGRDRARALPRRGQREGPVRPMPFPSSTASPIPPDPARRRWSTRTASTPRAPSAIWPASRSRPAKPSGSGVRRLRRQPPDLGLVDVAARRRRPADHAGGRYGGLRCWSASTSLRGKELWKAIDCPEVGYVPPVIFTFGGVRQLIQWHPRAVTSLDPATGAVLGKCPSGEGRPRHRDAAAGRVAPLRDGVLQWAADARGRGRREERLGALEGQEREREGDRGPTLDHVHAMDDGDAHLRSLQLRAVALPRREDGGAPLGDAAADGVRAAGGTPSSSAGGPLLPAQRAGGPHHRDDGPRGLHRAYPVHP